MKDFEQIIQDAFDHIDSLDTSEKKRAYLLNQWRTMVRYWANVEDHTCEEKLSGLLFSVLNTFDGTGAPYKPLDIVWGDDVINDDVMLHEVWYGSTPS